MQVLETPFVFDDNGHMEPWVNALLTSAGGGVALATVALTMGVRRLEMIRGATFSKAQKIQTWLTIFGVFTAFSFFLMSLFS